MPADKNIEGNLLLDLFYRLIREQTLIKVSLPDTAFESLTVLTDLKMEKDAHLFQIDMPEGLISAMQAVDSTAITFEFTGDDRLTHRFEAIFDTVTEKSIWLSMPAAVQRFQMRNNFRIKVHQDSYATIETEEATVRMEIDNLSVGGVYCYCANKHKALMQLENKLEHMKLYITARRDCFLVPIDQVIVKRIEPWMRPKHFGVAFEFIQIQKSTRQLLIRQIYDLQRDFLQGRLKLNS